MTGAGGRCRSHSVQPGDKISLKSRPHPPLNDLSLNKGRHSDEQWSVRRAGALEHIVMETGRVDCLDVCSCDFSEEEEVCLYVNDSVWGPSRRLDGIIKSFIFVCTSFGQI